MGVPRCARPLCRQLEDVCPMGTCNLGASQEGAALLQGQCVPAAPKDGGGTHRPVTIWGKTWPMLVGPPSSRV